MPVFVAGVGMTPFGRHPAMSVSDLAGAAMRAALDDADCDPGRIEAAWFANAVQGAREGQHMIRGQVALRPHGLSGIPVTNVENACASGFSALQAAVHFIKAGAGDIALVVGAERMTSEDRQASLSLLDGGLDIGNRQGVRRSIEALGGPIEAPGRRSIFMDIYAAFARQHRRLYGSTSRELAAVAAKNRNHGRLNPRAQFREATTADAVLGARMIVDPLTLPMCAPVSDGAAAAVVCSERGLDRLGVRARAIEIRACAMATGTNRAPDDMDRHVGRIAAHRAYEQAGLGPEDVDLAEVHDAAAIGEMIQIENLGLVPRGEGGAAALRGETALGGRIPVNASGGLLSRGHPIGATGLAQMFELVMQLRGTAGAAQVPGARIAIAENGGGVIGCEEAVCGVTVLAANSC